MQQADGQLVLRAAASGLVVERATGLIDHYARHGQVLLAGGTPDSRRAPTDNDLGTGFYAEHLPWKMLSENRRVAAIDSGREKDGGAWFEVAFALGGPDLRHPDARFAVRYRMYPEGPVQVDARFVPQYAGPPDPPRLDMAFSLPMRYTDLRWDGRGPYETYADRYSSGEIAPYSGRIAEQNRDYIRPQATGN